MRTTQPGSPATLSAGRLSECVAGAFRAGVRLRAVPLEPGGAGEEQVTCTDPATGIREQHWDPALPRIMRDLLLDRRILELDSFAAGAY